MENTSELNTKTGDSDTVPPTREEIEVELKLIQSDLSNPPQDNYEKLLAVKQALEWILNPSFAVSPYKWYHLVN